MLNNCSYFTEKGSRVISLLKLTVCSMRAGALEAVNEVDASSTVEAGLRVAFVDVIFTVDSLVAWFALRQRQENCCHTNLTAQGLICRKFFYNRKGLVNTNANVN